MIANKHSGAVGIELSDRQTGQVVDNVKQKSSNTVLDENITAKTPTELFEEFYSGVTLHGFRFLFEGIPLRRIIWLFITTGVFAFSIYLFNGLVKDYFLHKTNTSFSERFEEGKRLFPTVTICPNNPYSVDKVGPGTPLGSNISSIRSFEWSRDKNNEERLKILELIKKQNITDFMSYLRLLRLDTNEMLNSTVRVILFLSNFSRNLFNLN